MKDNKNNGSKNQDKQIMESYIHVTVQGGVAKPRTK